MAKKKTSELRNRVLEIVKRIRAKDRAAEDELIRLHKQKYGDKPCNSIKRGECQYYRNNLEIMIQNLLR